MRIVSPFQAIQPKCIGLLRYFVDYTIGRTINSMNFISSSVIPYLA